MAVTRGAGVALTQPKGGDKSPACMIEGELEMHSLLIVFAASKAVILLERELPRPMSANVNFIGHWPCILTDQRASGRRSSIIYILLCH